MRLTEFRLQNDDSVLDLYGPRHVYTDERVRNFVEWLAAASFKLEAVNTSRMHQLMESLTEEGRKIFHLPGNWPQIFLIQHDWASAFGGDPEFNDRANSCQLPAPVCCFEFMASGMPILAETSDLTGKFLVNIRVGKWGWFQDRGFLKQVFAVYKKDTAQAAMDGYDKLCDLIYLNIRAACVALEAEIAETEVVRAPSKLNKARLRCGKEPLNDFNIINLAKRKRYAPVPLELQDEDKRNGVRLHFRRGHTRHYPNYNVWIKWQLVGNPDLGFIDKDYKL